MDSGDRAVALKQGWPPDSWPTHGQAWTAPEDAKCILLKPHKEALVIGSGLQVSKSDPHL